VRHGVWPGLSPRPHEIPYHVVLKGRAIIEDPETGTARELVGGDTGQWRRLAREGE
jgi:hypothetical protein